MNEPSDINGPAAETAAEAQGATPESGGAAAALGTVQEIAEDMLDVLERLGAIERLARNQARTLETLRRELVGAHRALTVRSVFEAVAASLDSLEAARLGLEPDAPGRANTQLALAASVLNILLQTLGFERFEVAPGAPFQPDRMECLGYGEGEQGRVLEVVRVGYCAGDVIARPAGVLIADPSAPRKVAVSQTAAACENTDASPQEGSK